MNKNISGPMKMFNKFNPFGSDTTSPYVVPPPTAATPYYNYYTTPQGGAVAQPPATPQVPVVPPVAAPALAPAPALQQPTGAETAKDGHSSVIKEGDKFVAMTVKG
jgi:hypothetical protein